jgi:diketogulonate reductase-like aldo/keto reductase
VDGLKLEAYGHLAMIYGTAWKGDQTADPVAHAFEAGFRAFDTAAQPRHYREELVGEGIRKSLAKSGTKREDLCIRRLLASPLKILDP